MSKKLFAYHFTAILRRVRIPLLVIPGGVLFTFFTMLIATYLVDSGIGSVLEQGLTAVFFLLIAAFVAILAYSLIHIFLQHYRSFFGSESAFFTMIPATANAQFAACLFSGILWGAILFGTFILSFLFGIILPIELFGYSWDPGVELSFLTPLALFLGVFAFFLIAYAGMTVGALLFDRRRAFGAPFCLILFMGASLLLFSGTLTVISPFTDGFPILSDLFSSFLALILGGSALLVFYIAFRRKLNTHH